MSAGIRVEAYLEAVRTALAGALTPNGQPVFEDVRVHLDVYDLEDLLKESIRTPSARVVFSLGKPEQNLDGGYDAVISFVVAVITRRTGRPAAGIASADASAITILFDVAALVASDPYFGLAQVGAARPGTFSVNKSEKSSTEGVAIASVEFEAKLLRLVPLWPQAAAMFAPGAPAGGIVLTSGGSTLIPEPQP